jgi:predicted PilT family ATPase
VSRRPTCVRFSFVLHRAHSPAQETTFDLESRFVGYIVGKNGANINKLNTELGVKVNIDDSEPLANGSSSKSKKPRQHFVIRGRRENVEEAKKRIIAHAERVADEGVATVPLPSGVDRRVLIGKEGVYAQRLESKYEVKIVFPRMDDSADISIRGPRKGVESARKEVRSCFSLASVADTAGSLSSSSNTSGRTTSPRPLRLRHLASRASSASKALP